MIGFATATVCVCVSVCGETRNDRLMVGFATATVCDYIFVAGSQLFFLGLNLLVNYNVTNNAQIRFVININSI